MKIGVFIPLNRKFEDYYWSVRECYEQWDEIYTIHGEVFTPTNGNETIVRNAGLEYFKRNGFDFVFQVDADEFMLPEDQRTLVDRMSKGDYGAGLCKVYHYTKDLEHIYKPTDHKPITILDPSRWEFYDGRCARGYGEAMVCEDLIIHHLGFTFSDEKMQWKKENYWNPSNPDEISRIISLPQMPMSLPEEIKKMI